MKLGSLVTNKHTGDLAIIVSIKRGGLGTTYLTHHFDLNYQCWLSAREVEVINENR